MIGKLKAFAAGFLVGVFVAPRSGRASRQLLMERINEFFEMGSRQLDELEDELAGHRAHREVEWSDEEPVSPEEEIGG